MMSSRFCVFICIAALALMTGLHWSADAQPTTQPDPATLKPAGDGWTSLIGKDLSEWKAEPKYWKIEEAGVLHGMTPGEKEHHYCWTEKSYSDFELHADFKLVGNNTGICFRIAPVTFDNVPGYQADIGDGYWGCLWEEHGRGKVVNYPRAEADKIVKKNDWNHYFVRAKGHHIEAWLNGVKTVDIVDEKGPLSGRFGFQLTHGEGRVSDATYKNVMYRELK